MKLLKVIGILAVAAALVFLGVSYTQWLDSKPVSWPEELFTLPTRPSGDTAPSQETQPTETEAPATIPVTEPPTEPSTEAATDPTEPPAEPEPEHFTLTFLGDCTLGSTPKQMNATYSILWYIKEDYDYPFRNVMDCVTGDDLTVINLESTFCENGPHADALFTFRAPTNYVNVISQNSIEAVSFANNHTMDYMQEGYDSTIATLKEANIPYVEKDSSMLMTTESGLTVGFYALSFSQDAKDMEKEIKELRKQGAELVIVSAHWGVEGSYRANASQTEMAHAAIDAGADIVYGHHPHTLQRIEEYKDGIIYYSLANFIFGGNHWPQDLDSAILQQEVIRDTDGSISLGELTIIPVSVSSQPRQNVFQPTPYEPGTTEYDRVLSKLDGTFTGGDLVVDYDKVTGGGTTEPPAETPTEAPAGDSAEAPAETPTAAPTQAPSEPVPETPTGDSA